MDDFGHAIALNPADARAYFNRACACHYLGQETAALTNFDQVLTLDPSHSRTYLKRGLIRQDMGDRMGAIADLQTAAYHAHKQGAVSLHRYVLICSMTCSPLFQ
ncbi:MAG: tetratricopeptide repeat protein [Cyanobacteria bacterium Co-bin8]|nr:tetratricopeptide repeat protein [Cyanobacteria bacterium Co-bin8]